MNIKNTIINIDSIGCLTIVLKKIWFLPSLLRRKRMIKNYFASVEIKKLQIGSAQTIHDDWLCTDIAPRTSDTILLDATKVFPFGDNTFDYIYTEHMIEHISWKEGLFMLQECSRILKPGGIIRIATPDMKVIIGLYYNNNPLNNKYVTWITDNFLNDVPVYKAPYVINSAFRNWGHTFLYDADLLKMTMNNAGFTNLEQCSYGESKHDELENIERHGDNVSNIEMAKFETMIFEGVCLK